MSREKPRKKGISEKEGKKERKRGRKRSEKVRIKMEKHYLKI